MQPIAGASPGSKPGGALEHKVQPWMGVAAALVLTFLALFPYRNFAGDDAYISFRFARNFAEGI